MARAGQIGVRQGASSKGQKESKAASGRQAVHEGQGRAGPGGGRAEAGQGRAEERRQGAAVQR